MTAQLLAQIPIFSVENQEFLTRQLFSFKERSFSQAIIKAINVLPNSKFFASLNFSYKLHTKRYLGYKTAELIKFHEKMILWSIKNQSIEAIISIHSQKNKITSPNFCQLKIN